MTKFRNALPGVLATMAAAAVGALTPEVIAQLADAPDMRAIIGALVASAAYRLRPLAVKSEAPQ